MSCVPVFIKCWALCFVSWYLSSVVSMPVHVYVNCWDIYISSVGSLPSAHVGLCIKTVSSICLMSGYVPKQCQIFV